MKDGHRKQFGPFPGELRKNPMKVVERLKKIIEEMSSLKEQCGGLLTAKHDKSYEMVSFLKHMIPMNRHIVFHLSIIPMTSPAIKEDVLHDNAARLKVEKAEGAKTIAIDTEKKAVEEACSKLASETLNAAHEAVENSNKVIGAQVLHLMQETLKLRKMLLNWKKGGEKFMKHSLLKERF